MSNATESTPIMSTTTASDANAAKASAPKPPKPRQHTNRLTSFKRDRSCVDLYIEQATSILGEDKAARFRVYADLEERKAAIRQFIANKRCKLLGDTFSAFSLLRPDRWDTYFPALAKLCPSGLLTIVAMRHETKYAHKAAALQCIQASNNTTSIQVQDASPTSTGDEKSLNVQFTAQEAPVAVKAEPVHYDSKLAQVETPADSPVALEQVAALELPSVTNLKRHAVQMSTQDRTKPDPDSLLESERKRWRSY